MDEIWPLPRWIICWENRCKTDESPSEQFRGTKSWPCNEAADIAVAGNLKLPHRRHWIEMEKGSCNP